MGWSGTPLTEVFAQLAAMGGECVEVNGNSEKHHAFRLTSQTAPTVRAWAEAVGLVVGSLSGYSDFAQHSEADVDRQLEGLLETCRAASAMEVPVVRAFVGEPKPGLDFQSAKPRIIDAFRRAAQACEPLGVSIAIENHGLLVNDGPELAALVSDIGADNVGLTIDTGNFAWAGHDPERTATDLAAAVPLALNVHVKDGRWLGGGFEFVPAGEGEIGLADLFKQLEARGFGGMVYSEYEGSGPFLESTRRSITYLKSVR